MEGNKVDIPTREQQRKQFATEQYNLLVAEMFSVLPREMIESETGQRVVGYFWGATTARFEKLWEERESLLACVEKANQAAVMAGNLILKTMQEKKTV